MKTLVETKAERRRWLGNIPEPAIGTNDVVIRVRYTGIGESEGVVLRTAKLVVYPRPRKTSPFRTGI